MTASTSYTTIVCLNIEQSADGWYALSSPEVKQFFMAGKDLTKLLDGTPEVLKTLFKLNYGMNVKVTPVDTALPVKPSADQGAWTRLPSRFAAVPLAA